MPQAIRLVKVFAFGLALVLGPLGAAFADDGSLAQRLVTLEQAEKGSFSRELSEKQREDLIVSMYERLFPYDKSRTGNLPVEDLKASFQASFLASFYGIRKRDIEQLEGYFRGP